MGSIAGIIIGILYLIYCFISLGMVPDRTVEPPAIYRITWAPINMITGYLDYLVDRGYLNQHDVISFLGIIILGTIFLSTLLGVICGTLWSLMRMIIHRSYQRGN